MTPHRPDAGRPTEDLKMGQLTDFKIRAWQERAGITPATGQYAKDLEEISQAAFELIKVIEMERSGIRDGDGYWHGSDVLHGSMKRIVQLFERETDRIMTEITTLEEGEPDVDARIPHQPDAGRPTEDDVYKELMARSDMENKFREIINEAVRSGSLGNFNNVIAPALANLLVEQVTSSEGPLQRAYLVSLQHKFSELLVAICERDGHLHGIPPIGASSEADPLPF